MNTCARLGLLALLAGFPLLSQAQVPNGSFESDFDGWQTIGAASIQTAAFGTPPSDGAKQALITTGSGSVAVPALEDFLQVAPGSISALMPLATQGSAIAMTLDANAGAVVVFDFNFLTSVDGTLLLLADTSSSFVLSATPFNEETGYQTASIAVQMTTTGSQQLGFAVLDLRDTAVDSGLLIDKVEFLNRPPDCTAAVASPSVLWPPDQSLVPIQVDGVVDPDGDALAIAAIQILQNEPVRGPRAGNTAPDATLEPIAVRAERMGGANGRTYQIDFAAADGKGGVCTGRVSVCVPHGASDSTCGAPSYDSTVTE